MATLEITTMIGCPLSCTFCPQDSLRKSYGSEAKQSRYITFETFKTCVDKLPSHVRIDFSGYSEPFANPKCMDLIEYSAKLPNEMALYTTLTGLSPQDSTRLKDLIETDRFSEIVLHIPDASSNMPGFRITDQYLVNLASILALPNVKVMTMDGKNAVLPDIIAGLEEKGDSLVRVLKTKLDGPGFHAINRAGSLISKSAETTNVENPVDNSEFAIGCASTPFYDHNVLLPNGDVTLCCMDYSLKHILGNLIDQDYYELFSSEELRKISCANMMTNSEPEKTSVICNSCSNVTCYSHTNGRWSTKRSLLRRIADYGKLIFRG